MSEISEKVFKIAEPIVTSLGYELVEVEYAKKFNGYNLTIFINNNEGITLDDCEKVSRALDEILDQEDPTHGESYTFNVSSLGLDRPIKTDKDFQRNIGKEIEVKFYHTIEGKKSVTGFVKEFDEKTVTLENNGKLTKIERDQIAKAVLVIHF